MKSRKYLLAASALLVLCGLASCGDAPSAPTAESGNEEKTPAAETVVTEEAGTPRIDDGLDGLDFSGKTYTVLYRDEDEHLREITAKETTGDIINDAVFDRTAAVEERFGVTLGLYPVNESDLNKTFTNLVQAGDHAFNVAFQHMIFTSSLAAAGMTVNWYDVPHLDFSKPWWTSSVDSLTVNGVMYVAASDYCLNTFEMAWCLIFNKQMLADLALDDNPYDLVKAGKWTIDKYNDMAKGVSADINGDGAWDENDRYGINSYGDPWFASISNYWWACGERISRFDENGIPYFAMESEKTQEVFDKMYRLLNEENTSYMDKTKGMDMIFWKGQSLFASMMIRDVEVNRDKDLPYGLIPYPKYDESQEKYENLVDGHASMMALPMFLDEEELDFTGAMIEAFSAEAYSRVIPAYYETAMQVKFAQDENMSEMLEIIRQGRVFNFGYLYDTVPNRDILVNLIIKKKTDLSSQIEKAKKKTVAYYDKVITEYMSNAN